MASWSLVAVWLALLVVALDFGVVTAATALALDMGPAQAVAIPGSGSAAVEADCMATDALAVGLAAARMVAALPVAAHLAEAVVTTAMGS